MLLLLFLFLFQIGKYIQFSFHTNYGVFIFFSYFDESFGEEN